MGRGMCLSRSASEQRLSQARARAPLRLARTAAERSPEHSGSELDEPRTRSPGQMGSRQGVSAGLRWDREEDLADESWPQPAVDTSSWRWREFTLIYGAYMTMLIARKNYGFWLPSVLSDLGAGKGEAGMLGSTFEIVYGSCALLNGVLIDMIPPKHLLIAALLASGGVNLAIGSTSSLALMVLLWGSNGFAQSFGWPSITNIFLAWFPDPASRGSWYSLLSTCQNAGAALVPLAVSATVARFGWRAALYTPAVCTGLMACVLALLLFGSPAAVEACYARKDEARSSREARAQPKLGSGGLARTLGRHVLLNGELWLMAVSYFCISLVRTCLSDWSAIFLHEAKGMPMHTAARCLFAMESGGFVGSLVAGAASDRVFAGRRGPVVCICSALLAPALLAILTLSNGLALQAAYAWVGFCAFPVHVLLGLFSREVTPAHLSSSAGGFVKCIAQVGGAVAGLPLGMLQQRAGWHGVFVLTTGISAASALAALPLWFTTAQGATISARHGTVADFQQMQRGMGKSGGSAASLAALDTTARPLRHKKRL